MLLVGPPAVPGSVDESVVVRDRGGRRDRDQVFPLITRISGLFLQLPLCGLKRILAAGDRILLGEILAIGVTLDSAGDELGRHFADAVPVLAHAEIAALLVRGHDDHIAAAAEIIIRGENGAVRQFECHSPEIDPLVLHNVLGADGLPFEGVVGCVCVLAYILMFVHC